MATRRPGPPTSDPWPATRTRPMRWLLAIGGALAVLVLATAWLAYRQLHATLATSPATPSQPETTPSADPPPERIEPIPLNDALHRPRFTPLGGPLDAIVRRGSGNFAPQSTYGVGGPVSM